MPDSEQFWGCSSLPLLPLTGRGCGVRQYSLVYMLISSLLLSVSPCRIMLGDAFIPVLTSVFNAPPTSPLSDADPIQIADFLVHLSAPQEPNVRTCLRYSMTSSVDTFCVSAPSFARRKTRYTTAWPRLWPMQCSLSRTTASSLECTAVPSHTCSSPTLTRSVDSVLCP